VTHKKATLLFIFSAVLIGTALVLVRLMSAQFAIGSIIYDHPYIEFVAILMGAGLAWTSFIWLIPRIVEKPASRHILFGGVIFGIALRVMFLGSTPIYENDWNRYLWDGAVLSEGINPYTYSPQDVLLTENPKSEDLEDLQHLSRSNENFPNTINYGDLTTIYPPVAQGVFGLAALIKPFDLDVLRILFILIDVFSILVLIKILDAYGRDRLWSLLYILNPLLIYAGFNAVHMDIILVPFLLLALWSIKTRPYLAALALAGAGAVKLWPLLLAPILFRQWRKSIKTYVVCAAIVSAVFLILMSPLLLALKSNAGLVVYAGEWSRNAFFFPQIENIVGLFVTEPGNVTRIFVAIFVSCLSLWIGFRTRETTQTLPQALLLVSATLFLLSPTGYPWYAIWLIVFLPFVPSYGIVALTVFLPLYYTRYALTAQGMANIYMSVLIPLQFLLPALILLVEFSNYRKRHAR
jgi:hypothetical protein